MVIVIVGEVVEEEGAEVVTMTEDMTMEVISRFFLTNSFNGFVRYLSQVSVSYSFTHEYCGGMKTEHIFRIVDGDQIVCQIIGKLNLVSLDC